MAESWRTRIERWRLNFFPAYRRCGARLIYIADDWREVRVALPLTMATRNYVGTMFGGSMFSAADPVYMVMFIKLLGPGYTVWTKEARIRFKRPGRSTLLARFTLSAEETETVRGIVDARRATERSYRIDLVDAEGEVCAEIEQILHIRRRQPSR